MRPNLIAARACLWGLVLFGAGTVVVSCAKGEVAKGPEENVGASSGGSAGDDEPGTGGANMGGGDQGGAAAQGGAPILCDEGQTACPDGACVDLATDPDHCGDCDVACPPEAPCQAGFCICPGDAVACGTECVDTSASPLHCGACDVACGAGADCVDGVCECFDTTLTWCDGECVDLESNHDHCLGCGQACGEGEACTPDGCDCAEDWQRCDDVCVRLYDPDYCGDCETHCESGEVCDATLGCIEGCPEPREPCNGSCVLLDYDNANCGECENECDVDNGFTCDLGECVCPENYKDCGGECVLVDDDENCGDCGNACPVGGYCEGSGTTPACACGTDKSVCDASGGDPGFCVNLDTDEHNCGDCGTQCGADLECQSGVCRCAAGLTACGSGADAECVNTEIDTENCGACGTDCELGTCSGGSCKCDPGVTACAGICPDLDSNNDHCGSCNHACSAPEVCRFGTCSECDADERECDGKCVAATYNEKHCGGCDQTCPAGSSCSGLGGTACACNDGKLLCDNQCLDLLNDDDNCGTTCANAVACESPEVCLDGVCGCANGGEVCDGVCIDTTYSEESCGGCLDAGGVACEEGLTCIGGECTDAAIVVVNSDTMDGAAGTVSIEHELETSEGNARMLLVGVMGGGNDDESVPSSVTYDGAPLTNAVEARPGNWIYAGIFYLLDADLPAGPGTYTLTITNPAAHMFAGNVVELMGVDQDAPLDTDAEAQGSCGNTPTLSLDPGGADYTWTYDILTTFAGGAERDPSGGQEIIANPMTQTGNQQGYAYIGIKGPITPPATTALGWSASGCNAYAYVGVLLSP